MLSMEILLPLEVNNIPFPMGLSNAMKKGFRGIQRSSSNFVLDLPLMLRRGHSCTLFAAACVATFATEPLEQRMLQTFTFGVATKSLVS